MSDDPRPVESSGHYFHATPCRNKESIALHGLLSAHRARELGVGDSTTGWECGERCLHFSRTEEQCEDWMRRRFLISGVGLNFTWGVVRIAVEDMERLGHVMRPDPKSDDGLIVETDCIQARYLNYRCGETSSRWHVFDGASWRETEEIGGMPSS